MVDEFTVMIVHVVMRTMMILVKHIDDDVGDVDDGNTNGADGNYVKACNGLLTRKF